MSNIDRLKTILNSAKKFIKLANTPKRPNGIPIKAGWDSSNKRWILGVIRDGKQVGNWKWWRKTGQLHTEANYNDSGELNGRYTIYHLDGSNYDKRNYLNGKLHGTRTMQKANRSSDLGLPRNVHWSVWKIVYEYRNGEVVSTQYMNSRGRIVATRPLGVPANAIYTRNSEWQVGAYVNNQPTGLWRSWRNNGTLVWEATYDSRGKQHGIYKRYHPDGKVSHQGNYQNGRIHGTYTYYRSDNHSYENFPREANKKVRKVIAEFNNGRQTSSVYYDAKGEICNRHGNPIPKQQINSAFLGKPSDFLDNGFETYLKTAFKTEQSTNFEQTKKKFQELWGIPMPADLAKAFELLENFKYPEITKMMSHPLRFAGMDDEELNIVEDTILNYQKEYPTDNFMDWMTGTVCLDALMNKGYSQSRSYQYGLYDKIVSNSRTNQIYIYEYRSPNSSWGTNMNETAALDLSTLLYMLAGADAYENRSLITSSTFTNVFNKSKTSVNLGYSTLNHVMLNGNTIRYYDMRYRPSKKEPLNYYSRGKWLIDLLRFNYESYSPNVYPSSSYNKKLKDSNYRDNLNNVQSVVPEAIYWLFRTFFFNEHKYLKEYLAVAKDSPSRIIRDAASLVTELNDGRETLGEIANVQQFRKTYLR